MGDKRENRVEQIVNDLLRGRRLKLRPGDAEDKEAIIMAARLSAARQGPQRMTPAFRQRLSRQLESAPREGLLTRRAALVAGLGVAAGAVGGSILGRSLQLDHAPSPASASVVRPANGRWFDVGSLDDFQPGEAKLVKAGAVGAFVVRQGDSVSAVSSMCSDLPCELWWNNQSDMLVCPCHNRTFTAGGKSNDDWRYPLPSLDVVMARVNDGRVEVLGV
ncbi:MAG TPA: Rieske 2Fe-2S domain-containing protein [Candidatus Dormibacteraeota bacterium]|nr:Rieske 2Fe-2S domain-containing protein [Candidatus Dormibacteraeota bacterium]